MVVAIIALLAAILLPSLNRAREAGRAALCKSNLRQVGFATQMYLDDHTRYFPYVETVSGGQLWYFGLESPFLYNQSIPPGARPLDVTKARLYPYLRVRARVEICPSYDYRNPKWRAKYSTISTGYGYNLYGLSTQTVAGVSAPARIIAFADSGQVNAIDTPASSSNPMLEESYYVHGKGTEIATTQFRHLDRANALFVDGHVEPLPMAAGTIDGRIPSAKIGRFNVTGDQTLFQ